MVKHTLQEEPILKVNFFAVSVGKQGTQILKLAGLN